MQFAIGTMERNRDVVQLIPDVPHPMPGRNAGKTAVFIAKKEEWWQRETVAPVWQGVVAAIIARAAQEVASRPRSLVYPEVLWGEDAERFYHAMENDDADTRRERLVRFETTFEEVYRPEPANRFFS